MKDLRHLFDVADQETKAGNHKAAIRAYQQILKASAPDSQAQHLAHWGIGEIHLNNKDYDNAERHLKKAIDLKPDEPIYHYLLGCTFRYTDQAQEAVRHLTRAVELDSSREEYWAELGWVVGFKQDTDKGIQYLKKALALKPTSAKSLRDICMLYSKQYRWGEAQVCIEAAQKADPDNPDIQDIAKHVAFFRSEYERLSKSKKT